MLLLLCLASLTLEFVNKDFTCVLIDGTICEFCPILKTEEELKSLEGLQPASRCCKELDDFVGAKPDPFIAINQKTQRSHCFWKRLWGKSCFKFPWICCFSRCSHRLEMPNCCACYPSDNSNLPGCSCMKKPSCQKCCGVPVLSCPHRICRGCKSFLPKCTKMKFCPNCAKASYNPCCL